MSPATYRLVLAFALGVITASVVYLGLWGVIRDEYQLADGPLLMLAWGPLAIGAMVALVAVIIHQSSRPRHRAL